MEAYSVSHANIVAYLALIGWFPISILFFFTLRPFVATALSLLGAMLLLPTRIAFDLPGLPAFSREVIAVLAATLGCLFVAPGSLRFRRPAGAPAILIGILIVAPIVTALGNRDPAAYGSFQLPGLTWWDGPAMAFKQLALLGLPFLLGLGLGRQRADLRFVFLLLVAAALVYSLPILWEARMSPQLHKIVYGYHAHAFSMAIRWGGYRPMVFASFGIALALFVATATVAAATLARCRIQVFGLPTTLLTAYLAFILLVCKSLAAFVYGLVMVPIVFLARPRAQLLIACVVATVVFSYPLLRTFGLFPAQQMVAAAAAVSEDRAHSLEFRFEQEDKLLARARERIFFGWGEWKRNRVFDPTGRGDRSVTDGFWIIQLGILGLAGFVPAFGLLLAPVASAFRRIRRIPGQRDRLLVASLGLIIAFNATDQIPNTTVSPFIVFLSGALLGFVRRFAVGPGVSPLLAERGKTPRESTDRRSWKAATSGSTSPESDPRGSARHLRRPGSRTFL